MGAGRKGEESDPLLYVKFNTAPRHTHTQWYVEILIPVNKILLGNTVFADAVKFSEVIRVCPSEI